MLFVAAVMQCVLVSERILYHVLSVLMHGKRPPIKQLTDKGVFAAFAATIAEFIAVCVSVFLTLFNVFIRNVALIATIVVFGAGLIVLGVNGNSLFALLVNLYNSGVGVFLDALIIKPIQLSYIVLAPFLVMYNGFVWFVGQLFVQVFMPMLEINANALPDFMEGMSKSGAALSLASSTWTRRIAECAQTVPSVSSTGTISADTIPFTDPNMHCVANVKYLHLDLLTSGAFFRKASEAVFLILTSSCSALTPILEITWFPLLDYNLYAAIDHAVNFVLQMLVLPLQTWRRCVYGSQAGRSFSATEKVVMCTPDFAEPTRLMTLSLLSLGKLIDNWLDVALHVVEANVAAARSKTERFCTQPAPLSNMRKAVSALAGFNDKEQLHSADSPQRVVGLFGGLALTDGESTEYWNGKQRHHAINNWAIPIDARHGIAAVHFHATDARSALFGCRCYDTTDGMQVACASAPYADDILNRTVHGVRFDNADMTCASSLLQVHALRFPRRRYSVAVHRGVDAAQSDGEDETFMDTQDSADALIYLQPLCAVSGVGVQSACISGARNCFPYCMGVHLAGRRNHVIRLLNAREWRESIQYRQTDCALTTSSRSICAGSNSDFYVRSPSIDNATDTIDFRDGNQCAFDGNHCLEESLAVTIRSSDPVSMTRNQYAAPVLTLNEQPIVVAADIMLFKQAVTMAGDSGTGQIVVSRLRSMTRGLRQESLTTMENRQGFAYGTCEPAADESSSNSNCALNHLKAGRVLLPKSYAVDAAPRPAVASRWAVHWAVNTELSVLDGYVHSCQGASSTGFVVTSSIDQVRIWTLKTTRAVFAMGVETPSSDSSDSGVSYFVIPEGVASGTACHAVVNFEVDSMEFLDDSNVLVTTKASSLAEWPKRYEYRHYYLHPNRQDCYGEDGTEPVFSCWRAESSGPFQDYTGQAPLMAGELCPAMQRMPKLGSAGAHQFAAVWYTLHTVAQAITIFPTLAVTAENSVEGASNFGELFYIRDAITYHSVLDSAGNELLNFDVILMHIDKAMFHSWNTLTFIAGLWEGKPGHPVIEGVLVGTAKIKQFSYGDSSMFQDPVLQKLQSVSSAPVGQLVTTAKDAVIQNPRLQWLGQQVAGRMPKFVGVVQRMTEQMITGLKVNTRMIRNALKFWARMSTSTSQALEVRDFTGWWGKTADTLRDEMLIGYTDIMREQCEGLAIILGHTTPLAKTVRHACMLSPTSMDAALDVVSILISSYPTVACVCKLTDVDTHADTTFCRDRVKSLQAAAWTKNVPLDLDAQQSECFRIMDQVNWEFEHAFDEVFARMQMLADSMPSAIDYITRTIDENAGECVAAGAYTISIMPDPVDYFMSCTGTGGCRAKCLDNYVAFENALASLNTPPGFTRTETVSVQSKFFSFSDIEDEKHLPPFDIRALTTASAFRAPCGHIVFVAGVVDGVLQRREYCVPRDIRSFVMENGPAVNYTVTLEGVLQDVQLATPLLVAQDGTSAAEMVPTRTDTAMLVLTARDADHQRLQWCWPTLAITLLDVQQWDPSLYVHDARPGDAGFVLQSISRVRLAQVSVETVPPVSEQNADMTRRGNKLYAYVYVAGTRMVSSGREHVSRYRSDFQNVPVCVRLAVPPLDRVAYENVVLSECSLEMVPEHSAVVCTTPSCSTEVILPRRANFDITRRTVNHETGDILSAVSLPASKILARTLGLQMTRPLYLTATGDAARNTRHVAPIAVNMSGTTADASKLHVFVSGLPTASLATAEAWLHMATVSMSETDMNQAELRTSESMQMDVVVQSECTIENCVGCQSNPPSPVFDNVYMKCLAAQQCALAKCVGTRINLARPLCNIGAVFGSQVDMLGATTRTLWMALARQVILIVELSEQRRRQYEISWPEEAFVDAMCTYKDKIVEACGIVTSLFGSSALVVNDVAASVQVRTAMADSRWRSKYFITLEALTRFLSGVGMMPIYAAIALQKTMTCTQNDILLVITGLFSDDVNAGNVAVHMGSKRIQSQMEERGAVGMCLSAVVGERLRDSGMQESTDGGSLSLEIMASIQEVTDLARRLPLEPINHAMDASITFAQGVLNGVMDIAQAADFDRCKLPDITQSRIDGCVCGDAEMRIPRHNRSSSLLWCTGPLLLTDTVGEDRLVWNPYTFDELLQPGSAFDDYISCLSSSLPCETRAWSSELRTSFGGTRYSRLSSAIEAARRVQEMHEGNSGGTSDAQIINDIRCIVGCDGLKPASSLLAAQGIDDMQVIARCRGNYQSKQWDRGASFLGVFSPDEWQLLASGAVSNVTNTPIDTYARIRAAFISNSAGIERTPHFPPPSHVLECLQRRLGEEDAAEACRESSTPDASAADEFAYEPSTQASFDGVDACESFSNSQFPSSVNNFVLPRHLWSGNSQNSEPVASFHHKRGNMNRIQQAQSDFQILLNDIVRDAETMSLGTVNVETEAIVNEGDSIHQYVDCVLLGPYAAADMHVTFLSETSAVSNQSHQYHRGDPTSRRMLGGSPVRQKIMAGVSKHINDRLPANVASEVEQQYNHLLSIWQNPEWLLCACPETGRGASIECCVQYGNSKDLQYRAQRELEFNLADTVLDTLILGLSQTTILGKDVWQDTAYAPPTTAPNLDQRRVLRDYGLFRSNERVVSYDVDEVTNAAGELEFEPLWQHCVELLTGGFFTLPLHKNELAGHMADAVRQFNPGTDSSDEWLHAQEGIISKLLNESRHKTPVFWTHQHRYMPSDSTWCEKTGAPTPKTISEVSTPNTLEGETLAAQTVLAPRLVDVEFPGSGDMCVCGVESANKCQFPGYVHEIENRCVSKVELTYINGNGELIENDYYANTALYGFEWHDLDWIHSQCVTDDPDTPHCEVFFQLIATSGTEKYRGFPTQDGEERQISWQTPQIIYAPDYQTITGPNTSPWKLSDSSRLSACHYVFNLFRKRTGTDTDNNSCHEDRRCAMPAFSASLDLSAYPELNTKWQVLQTRGWYTSREDMYTVLEVMQIHGDADVYAQCQAPSVTWGLLQREDQYGWYKGTLAEDPTVSLQDIATHGPNGVRLRMLKTANGLATSIHSNILYTPDAQNPAHNFKHQHSIAQPYCTANSANFFAQDYKQHLKDVLFPMAHTVHVPALEAYCSNWAVEHGMLILLRTKLQADDPRLQEQVGLEAASRKRCQVQLEQMGICMLRGVFDMEPAVPTSIAQCDFSTATYDTLTCENKWILPNCLVACRRSASEVVMYDVERCEVLALNPCLPIAFDPRTLAQSDNIKLHSMHWPREIDAHEAASAADASHLTALVNSINIIKETEGLDITSVLDTVKALLTTHDASVQEGNAPDAFCDDLFDYFPADAQHPVGYHPSSAATRQETYVRGFDAWMSGHAAAGADSYDYLVDMRVRNSTTASRFFGAAHLVCDARMYGKILQQPKTYFVETQWNSRTGIDPAVPGAADHVAQWTTQGLNARQIAQHSPLLDAWHEVVRDIKDGASDDTDYTDYIQHSAGLIRNWYYGSSAGASWPQWTDEERFGRYGYEPYPEDAEDNPQCSEHPMKTCLLDSQCSGAMVCLPVHNENDPDSTVGICAQAGTCFMHKHCQATKQLCAANGRCVDGVIEIHNELGAAVQAQIFAQSATLPAYGFSEYENVADFAARQGQCSLSNWQEYVRKTSSGTLIDTCSSLNEAPSACGSLYEFDRDDSAQSLSSEMLQTSHPCDKSWQHTAFNIVDLKDAAVHDRNGLVGDDSAPRVSYLRTWKDNGKRVGCSLGTHDAGLLNPYSYYDVETGDTHYTLDEVKQAIQRCSTYRLCPVLSFSIDFQTVQHRMRASDVRAGAISTEPDAGALLKLNAQATQEYTSADATACGAIGQLTSAGTCIVDQLVLPLATVVYHLAAFVDGDDFGNTHRIRAMDEVDVLAPYSVDFDPTARTTVEDRCPKADAKIWTSLHRDLMYEYMPASSLRVSWAANELLPLLFGITFDPNTGNMISPASSPSSASSWTENDYLQHVQCAEWLYKVFAALQERLPSVYQMDPRLPTLQAGASLYVFHHRAHIQLPFHWFWQCVLLNEDAHIDWLTHLSGMDPRGYTRNPQSIDEQPTRRVQQCSMPRAGIASGNLVSVRERLRTAPFYFERTEAIGTHDVLQLALDVDETLRRGLDELGLPEFADLTVLRHHCAATTSNFEMFPTYEALQSSVHNCWTKSGRDQTQTLISDDDTKDPATLETFENTGLRAKAREHLFGMTSHTDLIDTSISELVDSDPPYLQLLTNIDTTLIEADQTFIPRLAFKKQLADYTVTQILNFDKGTYYQDSTSLNSNEYKLIKPEYRRFKPRRTRTGQFMVPSEYSPYVREEEAVYELLQWFYDAIRTTPTFRSENLFKSTQHIPDSAVTASSTAASSSANIDFTSAFNFDNFFRVKLSEDPSFQCTPLNELNEARATNEQHAQLASCVGRMHHHVARIVPHGAKLTLQENADVFLNGFYPAYIENAVAEDDGSDRRFLTRLTSDDVIHQTFDNFCFVKQRENTVEVLNPLWAGLFDLESKCDLEKVGSGAGTFHRVRASGVRQPPHCTPGEIVSFARNGTLRTDVTPLCERVPGEANVCRRRSGAIGGRVGARVSSLTTCPECTIEAESGMFRSEVFSSHARFTPILDSNTLSLHMKATDLGGHELHFQIDSTGVMRTRCVQLRPLSFSVDAKCRDWLRDISNVWKHEHLTNQQRRDREPHTRVPSETVQQHWSCPLQLIDRWSQKANVATAENDRYVVTQPNEARNAMRFAHITGNDDSAHPIVATRYAVPSLRPARFMSEHQMCRGTTDDTCTGGLSLAVQNILADAFSTVSSTGRDCSDILDWPHTEYILRDGGLQEADSLATATECFVQHRLPSFQLKFTEHASQNAGRLSSIMPGGPCHMGRLPRLGSVVHNAQHEYEDCKSVHTSAGDVRRCRYFDTSDDSVKYTDISHEIGTPTLQNARRSQLCSKTFMRDAGTQAAVLPEAAFVQHTGLNIETLNDELTTSPQLMSLGVPVHMKVARKIAGHIVHILCPDASSTRDGTCDLATQFAGVADFDSASWGSIDDMLNQFLNFHTSAASSVANSATSSPPSDTELWERPWVHCTTDTTSQATADSQMTCQTHISKSDWLDPVTRETQCTTKFTALTHATTSRLDFCLMNAQTELLCDKIAHWKQKLDKILCQASGAPECPDGGFFYSPTMYSISNGEFVYDTVDTFYKTVNFNLHTSVCVASQPPGALASDQAASNEALKARCASVSLEPLRVALQHLREIKVLLIEIIYYGSQVTTQFFTLLFSVMSASSELMQAAGNRMLMYLGMLLSVVADIYQQIARIIFALIFRDGLPQQIIEFLQALCAFVNWVHEHILGISEDSGVLCRIFNMLGGMLQDFADTLSNTPILDLEAIVVAVNSTGKFLREVLPCSAESLMECDFSDSTDDEIITGALPVATRCISSYQTFFGDNTPFSCTAADTCRAGLLASSGELIACALCPNAPTGYQDFGCEPHTKLCTCGVQKLQETPCQTNADCLFADTCQFINRFYEPAVGQTPCSECTHARVCLVGSGSSAGICGCGLQPITYHACRVQDLSQIVHAGSTQMCLLNTDAGLESQLQTRVSWSALASTSCGNILPTSAVCMQVTDTLGRVSGYFIVAHRMLQTYSRRRLLGTPDAQEELASARELVEGSHSPLCQDAAREPHMLRNSFAQCVQACTTSQETVQALGWNLPNTTFCSWQDAMHTLQQHPLVVFQLIQRPEAMTRVALQHTWLKHAHAYGRAMLTVLDAYRHDNLAQKTNVSNPNAGSTMRHLLSVEVPTETETSKPRKERFDLMDAYAVLFDDVNRLHNSHASQLGTAYESAYPAMHTGPQSIWSENWPPQYLQAGDEASQQCRPLKRTVELAEEAATASAAYFSTTQTMPSPFLADAWQNILTHRADSAQGIVMETNFTNAQYSDWMVQLFDTVVFGVLESAGVKRGEPVQSVGDIVQELLALVKCDLHSVQTCAHWRMRLPNAFFISLVCFTVFFVSMQQIGMALVAGLALPAFGYLVLFLAYGYSPMCIPLVPPCLLLDVYTSLENIIPIYIDLPAVLYTDQACAHQATVQADCLHKCSDAPWEYNTWHDPFAWLVAELGQNFADMTLDVMEYVPFIQLDSLRDNVGVKLAILRLNDTDTLFVHRMCALSSTYMLVPYLLLAMLIVFGGLGSVVIATRLIGPLTNLWTSLIIAASS